MKTYETRALHDAYIAIRGALARLEQAEKDNADGLSSDHQTIVPAIHDLIIKTTQLLHEVAFIVQ